MFLVDSDLLSYINESRIFMSYIYNLRLPTILEGNVNELSNERFSFVFPSSPNPHLNSTKGRGRSFS